MLRAVELKERPSPRSTRPTERRPTKERPAAWHTLIQSISKERGAHIVAIESAALHHRRGLHTFSTIRVGSDAADLLAAMHADLRRVRREDFALAPSADAFIYRRLFEALDVIARAGSLSPDSARWWRPTDAHYGAQLQAFREHCTPELRSALELRFARMLEPIEVAYVIGRSADEVENLLARGVAFAEAHFGSAPPSCSNDVCGAVQQAFSLQNECPDSLELEPLAPGTLIGDRYEIEAPIGEGAFACVYRARDRLVANHVVALKLISAELVGADGRESSLRELRHIASVFHPSVVQLKDYGWHDGWLWFVTPFYRGETLAERIERGPMSREEAHLIFKQLALALAALHDAGLRHQDVKPENILLARLGSTTGEGGGSGTLPVLIDLGVATKAGEGLLAGTPEFFAPEIAMRFDSPLSKTHVGDEADVYSLALCLRDALDPDGHEGVSGDGMKAFVRARATEEAKPPSAPDLRDLRPWFSRWLANEPVDRPTARELAQELDALTRPYRRRHRRRALLSWLLPSAAIVLCGSLALLSAFHDEANRQRRQARDAAWVAEAAEARAQRAERASRRAADAERRHLEQEHARRVVQAKRDAEVASVDGPSPQELADRLAIAQSELAQASERSHVLRVRERRLRSRNRRLMTAATSSQVELSRTRAILARRQETPNRSRLASTERASGLLPPPSPY